MEKVLEKNILITGASRGIGAATANLAVQMGYAVAVNYNTGRKAAEDLVQHLQKQGGKAVAIQADITRENEVIDLFAKAKKSLGPLNAFVNNAGIIEKQVPVEKMNQERLNRIFATNITGAFICAREAVRQMSLKNGGLGGSIVNVSSLAAKTGAPFEYVDYAASKAALDAFTIGLSKEVANDGIRVNAVRPAFIYTDIHAMGGEPDRIERLKESIPLRRGGTPEEVAEAIMWLISDKSSYSTGTFIDVSGGK